MKVEDLILALLPLPFCLLTLFVLVYYVRRRYKLYQEIKRIPREMLMLESYMNHLKNLKIKCLITNFIIVILVLEFIQNLGEIIYTLLNWVIIFDHNFKVLNLLNRIFPFAPTVRIISYHLTFPTRFSIVPILSLFMKFLWLVYRKYKYRNTIIRWAVYILVRTFVIFIINLPRYEFNLYPDDYIISLLMISLFLERLFLIIDFIQFVFYSKKFYLHLKSREREFKFSYFNRRPYLDSKNLRIHFKIATILVGIALFFFSLGAFIVTPQPDVLAIYLQNYPPWGHWVLLCYFSLINYIFHPSLIIYKIFITSNYLYIFIVVVTKFYKNSRKLKNINDYIKPIVQKYHTTCYSSNNYA